MSKKPYLHMPENPCDVCGCEYRYHKRFQCVQCVAKQRADTIKARGYYVHPAAFNPRKVPEHVAMKGIWYG